MSFTIAITGKGGVGKTTVAGLVVARLIASGRRPVLAVDADPNTCLDAVLGVPVTQTIGSAREEARIIAGKGLGAGISKQELLEIKIAESLVESADFDFLAMGRPEGPGCYCFANSVLRAALEKVAHHYPWVVIDNEAGLEHLSRRTTQDVDVLLIVSDATVRGITTAGRIAALLTELSTKVGKHYLIVNRAAEGLTPTLREAIEELGLDLLAVLPDDPLVAAFDAAGRPLIRLPADSDLVIAMAPVVDTVLDQTQGKEATGAHHR